MIYEFWKTTLNKTQKIVYDELLSYFNKGIYFYETDLINSSELTKVYEAIYYDHVELFQLPCNQVISERNGLFKCSTVINVTPIYSVEEIIEYKKRISKLITYYKSKSAVIKDLYEIEKFVCNSFIVNVKYEINNKYNQNIASVFVNRVGQCSGISKAIKYIFDNLNIKCIFVKGEYVSNNNLFSGSNHAWNIVEIENFFFHLDVTSIIGANLNKTEPFNYPFFNYSDDMMSNHKWDKNIMPKCKISKGSSKNLDEKIEVISSINEFRAAFKEQLLKKKNKVVFTSNIKCNNDNELINLISQECNFVIRKTRSNVKVKISVCGNTLTIECTYC